MTLILMMANRQQVVLVSDRRLTSDGWLVEDESNKAAVFICRNARLAVAYTGLAETGTFLTREWLPVALMDAAAPDYLMGPTVVRLRERATRDFKNLPVKQQSDKRLSIVLAGYAYDEEPPRCYCWLVSNYEGLDDHQEPPRPMPSIEFAAQYCRELRPADEPLSLVLAVGEHRPLADNHLEALGALLRDHKPARALIDKGVAVIRTAAQSHRSRGVIGKQCNSLLLPSDPNEEALGEYHSTVVSHKVFYPSFISARGDDSGVYAVRDPEVEHRDASGQPVPISVPKVGRNQPCPCGSGLKYKMCHGRPR